MEITSSKVIANKEIEAKAGLDVKHGGVDIMEVTSSKVIANKQIDANAGLAVKNGTSPGQMYFSQGSMYTQVQRNSTDSGIHLVYLPNENGTLALASNAWSVSGSFPSAASGTFPVTTLDRKCTAPMANEYILNSGGHLNGSCQLTLKSDTDNGGTTSDESANCQILFAKEFTDNVPAVTGSIGLGVPGVGTSSNAQGSNDMIIDAKFNTSGGKGKILLRTQGDTRLTIADTGIDTDLTITADNIPSSDDRIKINERLLPENTTELLMKVRPEIYDMLPYDKSVDLSNIENPTFDMKVISSSNYKEYKDKSIRTNRFE